jgi:hypothetical protein
LYQPERDGDHAGPKTPQRLHQSERCNSLGMMGIMWASKRRKDSIEAAL